MSNQKITPVKIMQKKNDSEKIVALTAYDFLTASLLDKTGIDIILVGDSLGMVVQGCENTLSVTVDDMVYHTKCVSRAVKNSLLVSDMPFLSYHVSNEDALRNAGKLIQQGSAQAVKLEGGINIVPVIEKIVAAGIPVMGHIGLTPQDILSMGGYFVQGKDNQTSKKLIQDAKALEQTGIFALVLECIPAKLAKEITDILSIPTIGIGAGAQCDGQILVTHDLIGLFDKFKPKFVKRYLNLHDDVENALKSYAKEVREGIFPSKEHSFFLDN